MKPPVGAFPPAAAANEPATIGQPNAFTGSQRSEITTLTDAANVSIDASASNVFELTATGAVGATRQLDNPTNIVKGMMWQVWFVQDGTGGRALTFDTYYDFGDEGAPDFTGDAANEVSVISMMAVSTTAIVATIGSGAPPAAHDLAGAEHNADTFANLNTKVSDETLAGLGTSQQFTKNQRAAIVALTDAATTLINADDGNVFELTATGGVGGTRQLDNPTNLVAGMSFIVIFNQDGTGSRALTFDTFYDFGDEGAPDFSAQAANISNVISCVALSTTQIACSTITGFA